MTKPRLQVSAVRAQFITQWLEVVSEGGLAVVVATDFGADTTPRLLASAGVSVTKHPLGWELRGLRAGGSAILLAPGYSGGFAVAPLPGNASQFNYYGYK